MGYLLRNKLAKQFYLQKKSVPLDSVGINIERRGKKQSSTFKQCKVTAVNLFRYLVFDFKKMAELWAR